MKKGYIVFLLFCVFAIAQSIQGQVRSEISMPPNGRNQRAEVSQWIGLVKITIDYHSPSIHGGPGGRDRTGHLWGEFIPFGFYDEGVGPSRSTPWRAGANESTTISFSHDVRVEGKDLKAGTYALFLVLAKDGPWTWIFSHHAGWGSYQYDPKNDALRVTVTPQNAAFTEFLTYGFDERKPDSAMAFLQWENKRIPFKVEVPNITELYVAQMRKELEDWPGFNYQNWQAAAQFCADNKINLEEALIWAEKAITEPFRKAAIGQKDFSTLGTKAAVLEAMGRASDADAVMDDALRLPDTPAVSIYIYSARLAANGRKERAVAIANFNQKQHPEEKFWTYLGLARAYTAAGDKSNAIKNWEIALRNVPEAQRTQIPAYENALKKLKES